jgi:hypothetical protein
MAIDGWSSLGVAPPPFMALFKPSQKHPYTPRTSPLLRTHRRQYLLCRRAIEGQWRNSWLAL